MVYSRKMVEENVRDITLNRDQVEPDRTSRQFTVLRITKVRPIFLDLNNNDKNYKIKSPETTGSNSVRSELVMTEPIGTLTTTCKTQNHNHTVVR